MNAEKLIKELTFKAIRSSGAGGQHVNKVSSKIALFFDVENSESLTEDEKELLLKTLQTKLTKENILILNCDESRSQHKNKETVITRFLKLIADGLKVKKTRKATKIPKSAIKKRLDSKNKQAFKKVSRRKPDLE